MIRHGRIMWIWRSLRQRMTNSSSSPSIPARSAAPWRSTRCIATMSARRGSARRATRLPSADESHGAADLLGAPALHRPWGGAERRDIGAFAGAQANRAARRPDIDRAAGDEHAEIVAELAGKEARSAGADDGIGAGHGQAAPEAAG